MDEREEKVVRETRVRKVLDSIESEKGSEFIGASIVMVAFREAGKDASLNVDEIARAVSYGKWFKRGEGFDADSLNRTLGILEEYKLLFKYPDGKYVYRAFK
jgi:hypothetical protein